jgi:hypothetical protein
VSSRIASLYGDVDAESYLAESLDDECIHLLERNLHTLFSEHVREPEFKLYSGNSEVFVSDIVPRVLSSIEAFRGVFPYTEIRVRKDLSEFDYDRQAYQIVEVPPRTQKVLDDLRVWCDQKRGQADRCRQGFRRNDSGNHGLA